MLSQEELTHLYINEKLSKAEIAKQLNCSLGKVDWWFKQYNIPIRTISEAIYLRSNRQGDPFLIKTHLMGNDLLLYGLGVGLFWGEGNKADIYSVRLGNTDPELIRIFVKFLKEICGVNDKKIRFGLQVFNDIDPDEALHFWMNELNYPRESFMNSLVVSPPQGKGIYRRKSKYGVLTIYIHNKKLRDWLMVQVDNIRRHSSGVERIHGKNEVPGSNPGVGSTIL